MNLQELANLRFNLVPVAKAELPAIVPRAVCKAQEKALQIQDRDARFMALPAEVQRIARQRRDFCRSVMIRVRTASGAERISQEKACQLVASAESERYPALVKGKRGGNSLTYNNFKRWFHKLGRIKGGDADWENLSALADQYIGNGRPAQIDTPAGQRFLKIFACCYERDTQPSMADSYRMAKEIARRDGLHPELFPSYEQLRYHYEHKVDNNSVLMARKGREWAENHLGDYITRTWEAVPVGSVWIGDHHQMDFAIRYHDKDSGEAKAGRPWLTVWMDARSLYVIGWIIRIDEHPDSRAIEDALLNGIRMNGNRPPSILYTDNGKDYLSKGFAEAFKTSDGHEHAIRLELGMRCIQALPFNARAKTVERFFKNVAGGISKDIASYLGNRPGNRPEGAMEKWKDPDSLMSLQEATLAFGWWLDNIWHSQGAEHSKITGGRTPQELWDSRKELRQSLSDEQLYFAMLKPFGERVVGRGGRLSVERLEYQSETLWPLIGKTVLVKVDRGSDSHVWAYELDGKLICEVKQVVPLPAIGATPEQISEAMAKQRRLLKHTRELHIERTGERKIAAPVSRLQIAQGAEVDDTAQIPEPSQPRKGPSKAPVSPSLADDVKLLESLKHGGDLDEERHASDAMDIEIFAGLEDGDGEEDEPGTPDKSDIDIMNELNESERNEGK